MLLLVVRLICYIMMWILIDNGVNSVKFTVEGDIVYGKDVRIACETNARFTILYTSSSNEVLLGGCSAFKDCFLVEDSFQEKYAINSTVDGGVLTIFKLDSGKYGIYTCTNAYNTSLEASVNITLNDQPTTTRPTSGYSASYSSLYVAISIYLAMMMCFCF